MIDEENTFNPFMPDAVKPVKKVLSKRRYEGWLMVDNRSSPGVPEEVTHQHDLPPGIGRGLFEAPTFTCSHCNRVVILNPLRNRERAYCRKCDHYLCDECGVRYAVMHECKTFNQLAEEIFEAAALGRPITVADPAKPDMPVMTNPETAPSSGELIILGDVHG